jgi:16S rRNA (cytosine1402-N4)-methyltransferase
MVMARDDDQTHIPVMVSEVLACLTPVSGGLYVDATLGLGGHAAAILDASAPAGRVIGFEWDAQAAGIARGRLAQYGDRLTVIPRSYAELDTALTGAGIAEVDGILVDLGVSSLQLDERERGFSFQGNAPLDMRMDRRRGTTAADLLARAREEELADIFYHYGEERQARRIAAYICEKRGQEPIRTTARLAALVAEAVPKRFHPDKIHVATRVFQAVRIAVNRELDNLHRLLRDGPDRLRIGGRFCVISFHSLEDRMVKQAFRNDDRLAKISSKPVRPRPEEVQGNPRARSAILRCAARC